MTKIFLFVFKNDVFFFFFFLKQYCEFFFHSGSISSGESKSIREKRMYSDASYSSRGSFDSMQSGGTSRSKSDSKADRGNYTADGYLTSGEVGYVRMLPAGTIQPWYQTPRTPIKPRSSSIDSHYDPSLPPTPPTPQFASFAESQNTSRQASFDRNIPSPIDRERFNLASRPQCDNHNQDLRSPRQRPRSLMVSSSFDIESSRNSPSDCDHYAKPSSLERLTIQKLGGLGEYEILFYDLCIRAVDAGFQCKRLDADGIEFCVDGSLYRVERKALSQSKPKQNPPKKPPRRRSSVPNVYLHSAQNCDLKETSICAQDKITEHQQNTEVCPQNGGRKYSYQGYSSDIYSQIIREPTFQRAHVSSSSDESFEKSSDNMHGGKMTPTLNQETSEITKL